MATVKNSTLIGSDIGGGPTLAADAQFGAGLAGLGDFDRDGVRGLAVGAPHANQVCLLLLNTDGTVKHSTVLTAGQNDSLDFREEGFGSSIAVVGDLNGDGIGDLAIGAPNSGLLDHGRIDVPRGVIDIAFMNADGSAKSFQILGVPSQSDDPHFGTALVSLGDIDGDGVTDLAASQPQESLDEFGGKAIDVLLMNSNGTVKKVVETAQGGAGLSMAPVGDLDGNGAPDLVVGNYTNICFGELEVLFLNSDGGVLNTLAVGGGTNGGPLLTLGDRFGAVTSLGDLDDGGKLELAVGARGDDSAGTSAGAVYVLSLGSYSAAVIDGVLTINVGSNRGVDVRVTRDAARSQFVVRAYDGSVVTKEFRFATSATVFAWE